MSRDEVYDHVGSPIELLVEAQPNYFAGRENLQLLVRGWVIL